MKAYILDKDYDHLLDMEFDAHHLAFEESNLFSARITGVRNIELPDQIFCQANFHIIPDYDFPIVDIADSIFSDNMLNIFTKLGLENYRSVPVTMLDDTYLEEAFEKPNQLKKDVKKVESYKALQLMSYTDAFNYDKSDYEKDLVFPEEVGNIDNLVLKEPDGGFPPIFRIKEYSSKLFVNEEAKKALESARIKGCVFEEIEVSS